MTVSSLPRRAVLARLSLAEHARQVHQYVALSGDTIEDMQRPGYFDSLSPKLRRYDRIEVVSDDGGFHAEFLVVESSNLGVRVVPVRGVWLGDTTVAGAPGAAIRREAESRAEYRGPFLKWCAVRGEKILRDKFDTEAQAVSWLNDHARTTSRPTGDAA